MFSVVCFLDTNEVDVAPSVWIKSENGEDICFYPPYKTTHRLTKAKMTCELPDDSWLRHPVKIMYGSAGRIHIYLL